MKNKTNSTGFNPSQKDLSNGLDFLWYELDQLCGCAEHINAEPAHIGNAVLESMLIHTRQLLDFFEHSKRASFRKNKIKQENDDILVGDYAFPPRPIHYPGVLRSRLNKDLTHLCYSRGKRKQDIDKQWDIGAAVLPIAERAIEFIEFIRQETNPISGNKSDDEWVQLRSRLAELAKKLGKIK